MEATRLMAQRFISIRNFEKYNPGSTRSYPWIKVYRTMLLDIDFLQLDVTSRYLYVCLLILASDHANKIPMNVSYLSHRCAMNVSEDMLKPLYRLGFLQASRSTIARLDKREIREDIEREKIADQVVAQPSRQLSDDEWLVTLRENPAYSHISIDQELGKMDAWLSTRPQKKRTRRFIVNWLNRAEKPTTLTTQPITNRPPPPPPKTHVIERGLWKQNYGDPKQYGYE
jgi:hypothetical protein